MTGFVFHDERFFGPLMPGGVRRQPHALYLENFWAEAGPNAVARLSGTAFCIDSRFKGRNLRHMTQETDLQERCKGEPQGAVAPTTAGRNDGDVEMDRGAAAHGHARTFDASALPGTSGSNINKSGMCENMPIPLSPFK
jgi:hypothetical protein